MTPPAGTTSSDPPADALKAFVRWRTAAAVADRACDDFYAAMAPLTEDERKWLASQGVPELIACPPESLL